MMFDFKNICVVDCMRSSAIIVAFVATLFTDKRGLASTFLKFDAITNVALGIGYLCFPGVLFDNQTDGKVDELMTYLVRCVGVSMLCSAFLYFLLSQNRSSESTGSFLLARTLSVVSMLMNSSHAHVAFVKDAVHFNDRHASFTLLLLGLLALGFVVHLLRFSDFVDGSGRGPAGSDRTPLHVLVDLLFVTPIFLVYYAFPEVPLDLMGFKVKYAGLHKAVLRQTLLGFLSLMLFALLSLHSSSENARRSYLLTRFLSYVVALPLALYYTSVALSGYNVYLFPALLLLLMANLFVGSFYREISERKRK